MESYELDRDEAILLSTEYGYWLTKEMSELNEMVLTNKKIIVSYLKKNGKFSKAEKLIEEITLDEIKIIDNKLQVNQIDTEEGICLQIQTYNAREVFCLEEEDYVRLWINAINKVVLGIDELIPVPEKKNKKKKKQSREAFINEKSYRNDEITKPDEPYFEENMQTDESRSGELLVGLKKAVESASMNVEKNVQMIGEKIATVSFSTESLMDKKRSGLEDDVKFCSNCGKRIAAISRFCSNCGEKIIGLDETDDGQQNAKLMVVENDTSQNFANPRERIEEFAGIIMKCPNCGTKVSQFDAVCPGCRTQITNSAVNRTVLGFKEELMRIENSRKRKSIFSQAYFVDPADEKKLALIRTFPIPNTIDEIIEIELLACANIDVSLSKNTALNKFQAKMKTSETGTTIAKTISDAWVSKLQQAYQKAEIAFPNEPSFEHVKRIYTEKMNELKVKL